MILTDYNTTDITDNGPDAKAMKELISIFKDWFGEDNVDFQTTQGTGILDNPKLIMIRVPKTTVTNEHQRSTEIQDLYIALIVSRSLALVTDIFMNRATYTEDQWLSGYRHSHLSRNLSSNTANEFSNPCLGEGPLKYTVAHLLPNTQHAPDYADLNRWRLFCAELSRYITVESLAGGPYMSLEQIGRLYTYPIQFDDYVSGVCSPYETIKPLVQNGTFPYLIKGVEYFLEKEGLTFGYERGQFILGMSTEEFMLRLSNHLIKYLNENVVNYVLNSEEAKHLNAWFIKTIIRNGHLYEISPNSYNYSKIPKDLHICNFHNEKVMLKVLPKTKKEEENILRVLQPKLGAFLKRLILLTINNQYGKDKQIATVTTVLDNTASSTVKRVLYCRL